MQIVLWGVLAATVALAALLDNKQAWLRSAELTRPITSGTMTFRLPASWKVSETSGATVALATEPPGASNAPGRMISIVRIATGRDMRPLEFLDWARLIDYAQQAAIDNPPGGSDEPQPTICGWPAERYQFTSASSNGPGMGAGLQDDTEPRTVVTCCVLPGGDAVAVQMDLFTEPTPEDYDLINGVAGSIAIKGVPAAPAGGGVVNLPNGVSVSISPMGTIIPQTDARLSGRDVRLVQPSGLEMLVEIVPFTMFSDQPANMAADALATHDLSWSGAVATAQAVAPRRQWKISPTVQASARVAQQAYAAVDASGRGLIAIFHADIVTNRSLGFDRAWADLSRGIVFGQSSDDYPAMLVAGTAAAQTLSSAPTSAQAVPDGTWWQWSRGDDAGTMSPIGWTEFDRTQQVLMQTRRVLWTGQVARWSTQYVRAPDTGTAIGDATEFALADAPDAATDPAPVFQPLAIQSATLENSGATLALNSGLDRKIKYNIRVQSPPQFVPGPALPVALGRIANDANLSGPVVLRTDWPAGWERAPAVWNAMSLFVRPVTGQTPGALRAVDVEINGSGEISRWYFHSDGTFDHADLPGGVDVRPGDPNQIKGEFAHDPRMGDN